MYLTPFLGFFLTFVGMASPYVTLVDDEADVRLAHSVDNVRKEHCNNFDERRHTFSFGTKKRRTLTRLEEIIHRTSPYDDGIFGVGTLSSEFLFSLNDSGAKRRGSSTTNSNESGANNLGESSINHNNFGAALFIAASALTASLMSLDTKVLSTWNGGSGFFIAFCTAVTGAGFSGIALLLSQISHRDQKDICHENATVLATPRTQGFSFWLLVRSILGGTSCLLAFGAISMLDLAVANTIMFTMPLWTAFLAFAVLRRSWDVFDVIMASGCSIGVVLTSEIWRHIGDDGGKHGDGDDDDEDGNGSRYFLGMLSAVGFAVTNAIAAIVVNTKLRGESALLMTFLSMLVAAVIASGLMQVEGRASLGIPHYFSRNHLWYEDVCLVLTGLLMVGQQALRNHGLSIATDSSVTTILYIEVVFSFIWDLALLRNTPSAWQLCGAALILVASISATFLRIHASRQQLLHTEEEIERKKALVEDENNDGSDIDGSESQYHRNTAVARQLEQQRNSV